MTTSSQWWKKETEKSSKQQGQQKKESRKQKLQKKEDRAVKNSVQEINWARKTNIRGGRQSCEGQWRGGLRKQGDTHWQRGLDLTPWITDISKTKEEERLKRGSVESCSSVAGRSGVLCNSWDRGKLRPGAQRQSSLWQHHADERVPNMYATDCGWGKCVCLSHAHAHIYTHKHTRSLASYKFNDGRKERFICEKRPVVYICNLENR